MQHILINNLKSESEAGVNLWVLFRQYFMSVQMYSSCHTHSSFKSVQPLIPQNKMFKYEFLMGEVEW